MYRSSILIRLLVISCLLPNFIFSQINDFGGITSFGISKKINRNTNVKLEQELRFNQDISTFDRSKTSIGVDYSIFRKKIKLEFDYDFMNQRKDEHYEFKQRASFGLSTDYKLKRFEFELRTKGQSTWRDNKRGSYSYNPKYVWRNKLGIAYDIFGSPVTPYISGEIFCPLNGADGFYMDGYRATTGLKYRISKHNSLKLEFRFDQEVQQANPQNIFYTGLGWDYKL